MSSNISVKYSKSLVTWVFLVCVCVCVVLDDEWLGVYFGLHESYRVFFQNIFQPSLILLLSGKARFTSVIMKLIGLLIQASRKNWRVILGNQAFRKQVLKAEKGKPKWWKFTLHTSCTNGPFRSRLSWGTKATAVTTAQCLGLMKGQECAGF